MQDQLLPILVFAQSGRFIAQSATQAGYRVWVADCFGDQDTLKIADRWQQLVPIHQLSEKKIIDILSTLSQGENCHLICGGGIEQYYPLLNNLPANITLIGNNAASIHTVQTPTLFFKLLKQLDLAYPDTLFEQPNDNKWLAKSSSGLGGIHIQYLKEYQQTDHYYYQRYVAGTSGSGLFIANGEQAQLLSINQQYLQPCEPLPFRLGGITSPWLISEQHQQHLTLAINKITSAIGLYGINSIDFIISEQNELLVLEINPRISASAELLNCSEPLFQLHINACNGLLAEERIIETSLHSRLHYYYAEHDVRISPEIIWPITCHDIPVNGSTVFKGEPICTLTMQAATSAKLQQYYYALKKEITVQLRLN
ncbi:MAG: ATP-grasp domain-containing protein [Methylophaga sp.]|nr:ATP-grasp domain-containing protein [Methylophaga sp.]